MAIRERLARLLVGGTKASIVGLQADEQPNVGLERAFDDATLLSTYRDDAWPYILANKIGEQASQAPLQAGTLDGDGEFEAVAPEHPVQRLLDAPNPNMDGGELVHTLMLYLEIAGHAPIEVVRPLRGRTGEAAELWLHNPGPWRIVPKADGSVEGFLYTTDRGDVRWGPDRMAYIRWPNPNDRWYGQGRIAAVRQEVMAEEYASLRDKRFEKQYGVPPGILSSKQPIGETAAEELRKRWEKAVAGWRGAGRIAVLGSETTYQPVELSRKDSEWLATRRWRVETLAAAFGVPMPLILMQDAKFANAEQARAEFWEGTLQPRLNRVARMLTARLVPLITTERLVLRFDYTAIEALGENDLQAAQTATQWAGTGATTVDEVRGRLGLVPHPDKAIGTRLLIPSTLALQSVEDITAPPPAPEAEEAEEVERPAPRRARKALRRERDVVLGPVRLSYMRDLGSFFAAQHGVLVGLIGKAGAPAVVKGDLPDDIGDQAESVINAQRFRDRLKRISEGPIGTSVTLGASEAAAGLAIETSFTIEASEAAIQLVGGYLERLSTGIQTTTVQQVRAILATGLREGWDNERVKAELGTLFDGWQDWRLERIARTETAAAYNIGSVGQYREAGIVLVSVVDGDGDPECAAANGGTWTLDQAEGDPLAHPNCTRTFIPITEGLLATQPSDTKADERHAELMSALVSVATRQPETPVVNVTVAERVGLEAEDIPPPVVTVAPPDMSQVAAAMDAIRSEVQMALAPRKRRIVRDENGRIVGVEEE